jgi:hypothetical protein
VKPWFWHLAWRLHSDAERCEFVNHFWDWQREDGLIPHLLWELEERQAGNS